MKIVATLTLALVAAGCAARSATDSAVIADQIRARTGAAARLDRSQPADLPAGIILQDGVTADEAAAVALWNSPDFQVSISALGFARADLLEAGLLRNPVLSLLFPIGPKQLEFALKWPIEVLWERPRRVAAAKVAERVAAERLIQAGLDLVASVKVAFATLSLAQDRQRLIAEHAARIDRIDQLTRVRLAAGDIGELEARTAQIDAASARQDAARAVHDVGIARERLRGLMGLPGSAALVVSAGPPPAQADCAPAAVLLTDALAARPDVRAAELAVEAAGTRLGWERSRVLSVTAALDANGSGSEGFEMGPGIDLGLPLFDRNQAGKARAVAEMQRASAEYAAAQQRVALEVREAALQLDQAQASQRQWRDTVVGPLQSNVSGAERAYSAGDVSYLFVLENARRLGDAQLREREFAADLQRARARLERAVGRTCGAGPVR